jgi:hypothetical protein
MPISTASATPPSWGRGADPADICAAVRYLLEAEAVTGQMLAVDGGQHLIWQTPDVQGANEQDRIPRFASAVSGIRHVFIRNLELPAHIGVYRQEKAAPSLSASMSTWPPTTSPTPRTCWRMCRLSCDRKAHPRHYRRRPCPAGGNPGRTHRGGLFRGQRVRTVRVRVEKLAALTHRRDRWRIEIERTR